MSLITTRIPKITKELVDELELVFQPIAIKPDAVSMDRIMFNAGQRSVVEWLRAHQEQHVISGDANALNRA